MFSALFPPFLQKVDLTSKAVTEVLARTTEYLQPNPGEGRAFASWDFACLFNYVLLPFYMRALKVAPLEH